MMGLESRPCWLPSRTSTATQDPLIDQPSSPSVVVNGKTLPLNPSSSESSSSHPSESTKHVTFSNAEQSSDTVSQPPAVESSPNNSDKPKYIPLVPPHSRSAARPTLYVKTSSGSQSSITFASSVASLLGSIGQHPPSPTEDAVPGTRRRRRSSGILGATNDIFPLGLRSRADSSGLQSQASVESLPTQNNKHPKSEPYFLRQYTAPMNPRDHTILEAIYTEMLSSRFINISPLSILQNYLEYHFSGEFSIGPSSSN